MTMGDNSVTDESAKMLKSVVERVERLNDEIKELQADRKAIFDQAKLHGFDTKVVKAVIKRRSQDQEELDEFDMLVETYWGALSR